MTRQQTYAKSHFSLTLLQKKLSEYKWVQRTCNEISDDVLSAVLFGTNLHLFWQAKASGNVDANAFTSKTEKVQKPSSRVWRRLSDELRERRWKNLNFLDENTSAKIQSWIYEKRKSERNIWFFCTSKLYREIEKISPPPVRFLEMRRKQKKKFVAETFMVKQTKFRRSSMFAVKSRFLEQITCSPAKCSLKFAAEFLNNSHNWPLTSWDDNRSALQVVNTFPLVDISVFKP